MTFEENPFRVLQVSIYDTKTTINERADDLSFEDPDREEFFEQARDILLNPRKRIAAEMRWFDTVDFADLFPLAGLNRLIYSFDDLNVEDKLEAVLEIDILYSESTAKAVREQINEARTKSNFPAVQDIAAIKSELKNIRYDVREKIQALLKKLIHESRTKFANDLAEIIIHDEENFGIIVEDFFECYRLEMKPFLDETGKQIISLLTKNKSNLCSLKFQGSVILFVNAIKPLDKFSIALGTNNFDESEEIFYAIRRTMIDLHNEKHLIDEPLILLRMLEQNFSYLPSLIEMIRKDIKFLEDEKARRPTKFFLDAKAALDKIQESIKKNLHFEKGFEQENWNFFKNLFPMLKIRATQN